MKKTKEERENDTKKITENETQTTCIKALLSRNDE